MNLLRIIPRNKPQTGLPQADVLERVHEDVRQMISRGRFMGEELKFGPNWVHTVIGRGPSGDFGVVSLASTDERGEKLDGGFLGHGFKLARNGGGLLRANYCHRAYLLEEEEQAPDGRDEAECGSDQDAEILG